MTEITEANVIEHEETNAPTQEAVLMAFSNDKTPEHLEILRGLLKMFYHATLTNRMAVMEVRNAETGEVNVALVGVEQNGDALDTYPLAMAITAEHAAKLQAPDGKGGWLERNPE